MGSSCTPPRQKPCGMTPRPNQPTMLTPPAAEKAEKITSTQETNVHTIEDGLEPTNQLRQPNGPGQRTTTLRRHTFIEDVEERKSSGAPSTRTARNRLSDEDTTQRHDPNQESEIPADHGPKARGKAKARPASTHAGTSSRMEPAHGETDADSPTPKKI